MKLAARDPSYVDLGGRAASPADEYLDSFGFEREDDSEATNVEYDPLELDVALAFIKQVKVSRRDFYALLRPLLTYTHANELVLLASLHRST